MDAPPYPNDTNCRSSQSVVTELNYTTGEILWSVDLLEPMWTHYSHKFPDARNSACHVTIDHTNTLFWDIAEKHIYLHARNMDTLFKFSWPSSRSMKNKVLVAQKIKLKKTVSTIEARLVWAIGALTYPTTFTTRVETRQGFESSSSCWLGAHEFHISKKHKKSKTTVFHLFNNGITHRPDLQGDTTESQENSWAAEVVVNEKQKIVTCKPMQFATPFSRMMGSSFPVPFAGDTRLISSAEGGSIAIVSFIEPTIPHTLWSLHTPLALVDTTKSAISDISGTSHPWLWYKASAWFAGPVVSLQRAECSWTLFVQDSIYITGTSGRQVNIQLLVGGVVSWHTKLLLKPLWGAMHVRVPWQSPPFSLEVSTPTSQTQLAVV
eukprot:TRINITY_DN67693_c8_g1_i1.p1 TRINITY_DN67693_c8_g1~~TRINITY_DN67693_c8_g1_i1.p1  ORF type:complete len:379 (-),score=22.21 TRINITY_DN67693_c8_g1_i1:1100-2236(-)